ncbi:hypothetical protein GLOIN_2v1590235 [Rhizophagus irregularis DAOM 181602=DAOM 197198]|nr:hypothetical protein GLOIN_2v1590235 [Rhizophagus irregularis DAOM 181602=DAOM 197198]
MATNLVPLFDYREFFYRRSFAPIQQEEELNLVYFFLFKGIAESWEIITEVSASASESKFFCECPLSCPLMIWCRSHLFYNRVCTDWAGLGCGRIRCICESFRGEVPASFPPVTLRRHCFGQQLPCHSVPRHPLPRSPIPILRVCSQAPDSRLELSILSITLGVPL